MNVVDSIPLTKKERNGQASFNFIERDTNLEMDCSSLHLKKKDAFFLSLRKWCVARE